MIAGGRRSVSDSVSVHIDCICPSIKSGELGGRRAARSDGIVPTLEGGSEYSEAFAEMTNFKTLILHSFPSSSSLLPSPSRSYQAQLPDSKPSTCFSNLARAACVLPWSLLTKDWTAVLYSISTSDSGGRVGGVVDDDEDTTRDLGAMSE
jgi:hypothetical protein